MHSTEPPAKDLCSRVSLFLPRTLSQAQVNKQQQRILQLCIHWLFSQHPNILKTVFTSKSRKAETLLLPLLMLLSHTHCEHFSKYNHVLDKSYSRITKALRAEIADDWYFRIRYFLISISLVRFVPCMASHRIREKFLPRKLYTV